MKTHKQLRAAIYAAWSPRIQAMCAEHNLDLRKNADVEKLAAGLGIDLPDPADQEEEAILAAPKPARSRLAPDHAGPDVSGIKTPRHATWRKIGDDGNGWEDYQIHLNVNRGFEVSKGVLDRNGHRWWFEVTCHARVPETIVASAPTLADAKKLAYAAWAGL